MFTKQTCHVYKGNVFKGIFILQAIFAMKYRPSLYNVKHMFLTEKITILLPSVQ